MASACTWVMCGGRSRAGTPIRSRDRSNDLSVSTPYPSSCSMVVTAISCRPCRDLPGGARGRNAASSGRRSLVGREELLPHEGSAHLQGRGPRQLVDDL